MNNPKSKSPKVSNKVPFLAPAHERMWRQSVEFVRVAPSTGLALEWETQIRLLFISLDIEPTPTLLNVAFASALEGESLSWLLARIEHEKSRAS